MVFTMPRIISQFKVVDSIIELNSIFMMNNLFSKMHKFSPKFFLHNKSMFCGVSTLTIFVSSIKDILISIYNDVTSSKIRVVYSKPFFPTLMRTEFPMSLRFVGKKSIFTCWTYKLNHSFILNGRT